MSNFKIKRRNHSLYSLEDMAATKLSQNDWTSKLPIELSEDEIKLFPEAPLKLSGPINKQLCKREPIKGLFEKAEQWKAQYLKENPGSKVQLIQLEHAMKLVIRSPRGEWMDEYIYGEHEH